MIFPFIVVLAALLTGNDAPKYHKTEHTVETTYIRIRMLPVGDGVTEFRDTLVVYEEADSLRSVK